MKTKTPFLLVAVGLLIACGTLSDPPPTDPSAPIDWPEIVQCGPDITDLIAPVSRILLSDGTSTLSDRALHELEDLAREHGPDTIACLVDALLERWTDPGATATPERAAAAARARGFLQLEGVTVERTGRGES